MEGRKKTSKNDNQTSIPEELWLDKIGKNLRTRDWKRLRLTCTFFNRISKDKSLGLFSPVLNYRQPDEESKPYQIFKEKRNDETRMLALSKEKLALQIGRQIFVIKVDKKEEPSILHKLEIEDDESDVAALAVFPKHSHLLASSYSNGIIRIWNVDTGTCVDSWVHTELYLPKNHPDRIGKNLIVSNDGEVVSASATDLCFYSSNRSGKPLDKVSRRSVSDCRLLGYSRIDWHVQEKIKGICFNDNGELIIISSVANYHGEKLRRLTLNTYHSVLDSQSLENVLRLNPFFSDINDLISMKASWHFKQKVAACEFKTTENDRFCQFLECYPLPRTEMMVVKRKFLLGSVMGIGYDENLSVWDINTGDCIYKLPCSDITNYVVMPDGNFILFNGTHLQYCSFCEAEPDISPTPTRRL